MGRLIIISAAALSFLGCGGDGFERYPVAGSVTLNGEPVEGAVVTFVPSSGDKTLAGNARTDEAGNFDLQSLGQPGLPAGNYQVSVRKVEGEGADFGPDATEEEKRRASMNAMFNPKPVVYVVPRQYSNVTTSGLSFEVTSDPEKNEFEIGLTGGRRR